MDQPILVILAGGKSSRMKFPKGLLPFENKYWLLEQIANFSLGNTIFVALGYDFDHYFKAIPWLKKAVKTPQIYFDKKVHVVVNKQPELGFFSTLISALKMIPSQRNLYVLPIDVPLVSSLELNKIESIDNNVVIPKFGQKNGHPIKISPSFSKLLFHMPIEKSRLDFEIKKLSNNQISYIEISDERCILNLNTPDDWHKFTNNFEHY